MNVSSVQGCVLSLYLSLFFTFFYKFTDFEYLSSFDKIFSLAGSFILAFMLELLHQISDMEVLA